MGLHHSLRRTALHLTFVLVGAGLSACAGEEDGPPASPEIVHAIEARKASYKEIGGAYKTITDEIKTGAPDKNTVVSMAREILMRAKDQLQYFPPGSGPESREKTRAKAEIWSDLAGFTKAHEELVAEAERLVHAAESGDLAALAARHKAAGEACKTCHDRFRVPDR